MKILSSKLTIATWAKVLTFFIANILCLIFFALNIYFGIVMIIFINFLTYFSLKGVENTAKWKETTLEKDSFFQDNTFILGSYSQYSLLAVSSSIIRIVNTQSTIRIQRTTYDISEIYKNYPRQGIDIELNGLSVYYFDIPLTDIKSIESVSQGDAGWFGFLKNKIFGVRITTKQNLIYDVDTTFPKEFCDEITLQLKSNN
jgi:hypothetical protein